MVTIHTDGSCLGNPGPGGWAFITTSGDGITSGAEQHTTNNRMELRAVIEALRTVNTDLEVVSDSRYVIDCLNQKWYVKWRANGWKNSQKKQVVNRDLWEELLTLVEKHRGAGLMAAFTWVKAHSGDASNTRVDAAARAAALSQGATAPSSA